jgi:glycosyltransferase involved in cell wall biosynthesis
MYTWLAGGLSWSYVMSRLAQAFDQEGHNIYFTSTNGLANSDPFLSEERLLKSILELQKFGPGKKSIDVDVCYTVPRNFPQRFLPNSKHKCAIYNYETTYWDPSWKQFYHLVDFYFPSSNFSAEIFHINGVPAEKIYTIPHGIDTNVFNSSIPAVKLNTKKKFKFVSVVAPHYRKNIELMLESYCEAFTAKDDVCLVLKTKMYKHSDGMMDQRNPQKNPGGRKQFEIVVGDIFKRLYKKHGKNMPEIELLSGHVENVSSIYNACDCHITTTGAEGFGMIFLEAAACGIMNIAPRYSAQLDFLNDDNALLIDTKLRPAKALEQYWSVNSKSEIGQPSKEHTIELMRKAVKEYDTLMGKFKPAADKMVKEYSWTAAVNMMIDATEGRMSHYIPGTYDFSKHERVR